VRDEGPSEGRTRARPLERLAALPNPRRGWRSNSCAPIGTRAQRSVRLPVEPVEGASFRRPHAPGVGRRRGDALPARRQLRHRLPVLSWHRHLVADLSAATAL